MHLHTLHTTSKLSFFQVFPSNLLAATQVDPVSTGRVIGRTEVERRDVYMKKLEGQFSESHPILVQLVSQCLDNDPLTRPSSEETLGRLQDKKKEIERIHGGNLEKILNIASILVEKEIKTKDKKIMDLQVMLLILFLCFAYDIKYGVLYAPKVICK